MRGNSQVREQGDLRGHLVMGNQHEPDPAPEPKKADEPEEPPNKKDMYQKTIARLGLDALFSRYLQHERNLARGADSPNGVSARRMAETALQAYRLAWDNADFAEANRIATHMLPKLVGRPKSPLKNMDVVLRRQEDSNIARYEQLLEMARGYDEVPSILSYQVRGYSEDPVIRWYLAVECEDWEEAYWLLRMRDFSSQRLELTVRGYYALLLQRGDDVVAAKLSNKHDFLRN